ncbi:MAG: glycosyltransferase family 1 protein [Candidatus Paceibacterota bacterium]|jgi:glycosyltransferase involved in cell wall biosynthesis
MKIAIDIRALQDRIHSGVQEYLLCLLEEIFKIDQENKYLLFSSGKNKLIHDDIKELCKKYSNVGNKHLNYPNKLLAVCWRFLNWPNLDKFLERPDVFFAPNINIIPEHILKKTIITFHDLSFKRFPEFFSYKSRLWHWFIRPKFLAERSKKIFSVSESTKQDIEYFYNIKKGKITVISLGKGEDLKPIEKSSKTLKKIIQKHNLPNDFILYLGTLEPRKNIVSIVKAYNLLRNCNSEFGKYKLVLAGPKGWLFRKIFHEIQKSNYKKDIFFLGPIDRNERIYLYNLAKIFVYPSFFEGFGLPILEAMSCGLPIIASNRSSLSSVVGEGGIMIDPYRYSEITWAMELLLNDPALRNKLEKKAIKISQKFNWKNCAQETIKLFKNNG